MPVTIWTEIGSEHKIFRVLTDWKSYELLILSFTRCRKPSGCSLLWMNAHTTLWKYRTTSISGHTLQVSWTDKVSVADQVDWCRWVTTILADCESKCKKNVCKLRAQAKLVQVKFAPSFFVWEFSFTVRRKLFFFLWCLWNFSAPILFWSGLLLEMTYRDTFCCFLLSAVLFGPLLGPGSDYHK